MFPILQCVKETAFQLAAISISAVDPSSDLDLACPLQDYPNPHSSNRNSTHRPAQQCRRVVCYLAQSDSGVCIQHQGGRQVEAVPSYSQGGETTFSCQSLQMEKGPRNLFLTQERGLERAEGERKGTMDSVSLKKALKRFQVSDL